jgi:hypothetical protein
MGFLVGGCGLGAEEVPFHVTVTNNMPRTVVDGISDNDLMGRVFKSRVRG